MHHRTLGRTGLQVSCLGLGTANFGERTDRREAVRIVHAALDAGINLVDTADAYGSRFSVKGRGVSEEILGDALRQSGARSSVVLATKVGFRTDVDDPNAEGLHRRHIVAACEASLRRLRTDHIDLYQIHRPSSRVPIDETLRALDDLVRSGKVRYIGTSCYRAWQIVESLWVAKEYGLHRVVAEQAPYNLLDRTIETEVLPMAQTYGIAVVTWSPLARGFLSGQYRPGTDDPADSRFAWFEAHGEPERAERYRTPRAFHVLEVVERLAADKACTAGQLALAWCLAQPGPASHLIGPRTVDHVHECLAATEIPLTADDRAALDGVSPPGEAVVGFYRGYGREPSAFRW